MSNGSEKNINENNKRTVTRRSSLFFNFFFFLLHQDEFYRTKHPTEHYRDHIDVTQQLQKNSHHANNPVYIPRARTTKGVFFFCKPRTR